MTSFHKQTVTGFTAAIAAMAGAQHIHVQVNGNAVYFPNAQPQYVDGRVLVPVRSVFVELGAAVTWKRSTQTVSAIRGLTDIELQIGEHHATVNGSNVKLDVPATVVDGTTMVPLRFISEALGAQVGWMEAEHLVTITSAAGDAATIPTPRRNLAVVVKVDEVIPVTLDSAISSLNNRGGDTFTATVRSSDHDGYAGIPYGTRVVGHIVAASPLNHDKPGIIELAFDRLKFPDGTTLEINGSLTALDERHISKDDHGYMTARPGSETKYDRFVYAGYGTDTGLLVGIPAMAPLDNDHLNRALGQVPHDKRIAKNVVLHRGTEMGIRLSGRN